MKTFIIGALSIIGTVVLVIIFFAIKWKIEGYRRDISLLRTLCDMASKEAINAKIQLLKYEDPWIPIREGNPMPKDRDDVLITMRSDESYGKGTDIRYYVDAGTYRTVNGTMDIDAVNGDGCFETRHKWAEGQPIEAIAWMPMPKAYDK